jgi:hypothetical protein
VNLVAKYVDNNEYFYVFTDVIKEIEIKNKEKNTSNI